MENELKKLLKKLQNGEPFSFLEVMSALSAVTDIVSLDTRPPAKDEIFTVCELNCRACCGD